jgi:hypothetical protein
MVKSPIKFNSLNNKICPFCQKQFEQQGAFWVCPVSHMRAWCLDNEQNIYGFRVWTQGRYSDYPSIRKGAQEQFFTIETHNTSIKLPMFDIFQLSFEELFNKIKTYILLS